MDISTKFSDKKRNLSDQYNNSKTGNKCTHRLGNPKQKKNLDQSLLNLCGTILMEDLFKQKET